MSAIRGEFGDHVPACPINSGELCRCNATTQGRHRMQYAGRLDPHQELVKSAMMETAHLIQSGAVRIGYAPAGGDPFKGQPRPDVLFPAAAFTGQRKIEDMKPVEDHSALALEYDIKTASIPAPGRRPGRWSRLVVSIKRRLRLVKL